MQNKQYFTLKRKQTSQTKIFEVKEKIALIEVKQIFDLKKLQKIHPKNQKKLYIEVNRELDKKDIKL